MEEGWYLEHENGVRIGPFDSYEQAVFAREGIPPMAVPPDIIRVSQPQVLELLKLFLCSLVICLVLLLTVELTR
jgi:hypothetical protein